MKPSKIGKAQSNSIKWVKSRKKKTGKTQGNVGKKKEDGGGSGRSRDLEPALAEAVGRQGVQFGRQHLDQSVVGIFPQKRPRRPLAPRLRRHHLPSAEIDHINQ